MDQYCLGGVPAMIHLWAWLDAHYVSAFKWLLGAAGTVAISMLSTALPKAKLTTRTPAVIAAVCGAVGALLGATVLLAKLLRPHYLGHLPWLAPAATLVAGAVLFATAWFLHLIYLRRTRQWLQPMVEAALRTIDHHPWRPTD